MFERRQRMFVAVLVILAAVALVAAGAGIAAETKAAPSAAASPAPSAGDVRIEVAAPETAGRNPAAAAPKAAGPDATAGAGDASSLFGDDDAFMRDPFATMRRMQEEMNRAFDDEFRVLRQPRAGAAAPRVASFGLSDIKIDMHEEAGQLKIACAMPGMDKSKIRVKIKDDILSVSGERDLKSETKDKNYYRQEISAGVVSRSLALPVPVDEKKAQARYENGVLTITVPRRAGAVEEEPTIKVE